MKKLLLNIVFFQAGWFSCVIGAANGRPWLGLLAVTAAVMIHLGLARRKRPEAILIFAAIMLGLVADSVLIATGSVSYPPSAWPAGIAPYWILAMWALFATTLNVSMKWMQGRPVLAVIMGAVGGPLSYLAGAKLGAIRFEDPVMALLALAIIWAVAMPLLSVMASRLDGVNEIAPPPSFITEWNASRHA